MIPWQATCIAIAGRGVLIEGPPGSGKSSLALALIDRGALLVGDDSVMLDAGSPEVGSASLTAHPHPATRGLLEVRNLGLLPFPVAEAVPVTLVIALDPMAPRFIDAAESVTRAGIALPLIRLWPESGVQAIKAELALERFGLAVTPPR